MSLKVLEEFWVAFVPESVMARAVIVGLSCVPLAATWRRASGAGGKGNGSVRVDGYSFLWQDCWFVGFLKG